MNQDNIHQTTLYSKQAANLKKIPKIANKNYVQQIILSRNPIVNFEGLIEYPSLDTLVLDETELSSFIGAVPQPNLRVLLMNNTPLAQYQFVSLMAAMVFGDSLIRVNSGTLSKKMLSLAIEFRHLFGDMLLDGWLITSLEPIRLYNVVTKRKHIVYRTDPFQRNFMYNARDQPTARKLVHKKLSAPPCANRRRVTLSPPKRYDEPTEGITPTIKSPLQLMQEEIQAQREIKLNAMQAEADRLSTKGSQMSNNAPNSTTDDSLNKESSYYPDGSAYGRMRETPLKPHMREQSTIDEYMVDEYTGEAKGSDNLFRGGPFNGGYDNRYEDEYIERYQGQGYMEQEHNQPSIGQPVYYSDEEMNYESEFVSQYQNFQPPLSPIHPLSKSYQSYITRTDMASQSYNLYGDYRYGPSAQMGSGKNGSARASDAHNIRVDKLIKNDKDKGNVGVVKPASKLNKGGPSQVGSNKSNGVQSALEKTRKNNDAFNPDKLGKAANIAKGGYIFEESGSASSRLGSRESLTGAFRGQSPYGNQNYQRENFRNISPSTRSSRSSRSTDSDRFGSLLNRLGSQRSGLGNPILSAQSGVPQRMGQVQRSSLNGNVDAFMRREGERIGALNAMYANAAARNLNRNSSPPLQALLKGRGNSIHGSDIAAVVGGDPYVQGYNNR